MMKKICLLLALLFLFCSAVALSENLDFDTVKDGFEITLTGYHGTSADIEAPARVGNDYVRMVGEGAFRDAQTIRSFTFPEDGKYTSIGKEAFAASSLESITLPEGLRTISGGAFRDCKQLKSIVIPASVTSLGEGVFEGCSSLETVVLLGGGTTLNGSMFKDCTALTEVQLQPDVTTLRDRVFAGCTSLRTLTLPETLASIGVETFMDCTSLTFINLPDGLRAVGSGAFMGCTALRSIRIPASMISISAYTFSGCSGLEELHMGAQTIYYDAFAGCTGLSVLVIDPMPAGGIPRDTFRDANLSLVIMPATPETNLAFLNQQGLDGLRLPDTATDEELAAMTEKLGRPWYRPVLRASDYNAFHNMHETPTDPALFAFDAENGAITGYIGTEIDVVIPKEIDGAAVRVIRADAFANCRAGAADRVRLRSVTIPETVEVIEDGAFAECPQLQAFVCYAPLETTGRAVLADCANLHTAYYMNSVLTVANDLFRNCTALRSVYLGDAVQLVETGAFSSAGVETLYLNAAVIEAGAVEHCPQLEQLHLGSHIGQMAEGAVIDCAALNTAFIEGENVSFLPEHGAINGISNSVTTYVLDAVPQAERALVKERLCSKNSQPASVTVVEGSCGIPHDFAPEQAELLPDEEPVEPDQPQIDIELPFEPVPLTAEDVDGAWYLHEYSFGGPLKPAAERGMSMIMVLASDGSMVMDSNGSVNEGVWSVAGGVMNADLAGEKLLFVYDGSALWAVSSDMTLVFRREQPASGEQLAPVVPVTDAASFNGSWNAETIGVGGQTMAVERMMDQLEMLFGMQDTVITINNGEVTVFGRESETFAFAEGILTRPGNLTDQVICLHADGMLTYEAMGMTFCCRMVETEPQVTAAPAEPVPEPAAAATVVNAAWADHMGRKYVAVRALSAGAVLDASTLGGEYAVLFRADGTADFTLVGMEVPDLTWSEEDGQLVLNYFGTVIRFDPKPYGFDMDYFGSMTLVMEPAEQ